MTGHPTLTCGFCGEDRPRDRILGGQSGALICDDCTALGAMVFTNRRAEAGERARRMQHASAAWTAWAGEAPTGIPVILTSEPRA